MTSPPTKLSRPQIEALRYASGRQLYARDVNEGDGNLRRTLLWLIEHGLLAWDPIYHGRLVLTDAAKSRLERDRAAKLSPVAAKLKEIGQPARPPKAWWNGLCPAGKHGLDFEGQSCDLCAKEDAR